MSAQLSVERLEALAVCRMQGHFAHLQPIKSSTQGLEQCHLIYVTWNPKKGVAKRVVCFKVDYGTKLALGRALSGQTLPNLPARGPKLLVSGSMVKRILFSSTWTLTDRAFFLPSVMWVKVCV